MTLYVVFLGLSWQLGGSDIHVLGKTRFTEQ